MMLMGGVLGAALSFGGATEYQELTAPHFHCQTQVASVYQYKTLREIMEMIRQGLLDPEAVVRYTENIHSEMPPDENQYDKDQSMVEEDWKQRFSKREHDGLSVYPKYLQEDTALLGQNLWQDKSMSIGDALQDAAKYKKAFFRCTICLLARAGAFSLQDEGGLSTLEGLPREGLRGQMQARLSEA